MSVLICIYLGRQQNTHVSKLDAAGKDGDDRRHPTGGDEMPRQCARAQSGRWTSVQFHVPAWHCCLKNRGIDTIRNGEAFKLTRGICSMSYIHATARDARMKAVPP